MEKKLKEAFFTAFITVITTFIFNILLSNFTFDKGLVQVGDLLEVEKGKYIVLINIKNFSDNNLDKIRIKIPQDIDLSSIKSNKPLTFSKISNNIGNETASTYEIARVSEKEQLTFSIYLDKEINVEDIVVEKNNNKISVEYPNDIKNPLQEQIIINSLIYGLGLGIAVYIILYVDEKRFKKNNKYWIEQHEKDNNMIKEKTKEVNEKTKEMKECCEIKDKQLEKLNKDIDNINNQIKSIKVENKKRELLLLARIKDYKKELDFWRDTIRVIFYKSQNKKIDSDVVFNEVTNNLKTYQTKNKKDEDFDMIKVMANIIKEE